MPRPIRKAARATTPGPASSTFRRRSIAVSSVLRPPLVTDPYDDDVDYEVKLIAPLTNRLTGRYGGGGGARAASVPPTTVTVEGGSGGGVLPPVVGRIYGGYGGYHHHHHHHPGSYFILTGNEHSPLIYDLETPVRFRFKNNLRIQENYITI